MFTPQAFKIQDKTTTPDGIGGFNETWTDAFTVYGYLDLITGSDQNTIQNANVEQSTHVLIVPTYRSWITNKQRVVDANNRWYEITHVDDPVGQHHHLEVYLKFGGEIND